MVATPLGPATHWHSEALGHILTALAAREAWDPRVLGFRGVAGCGVFSGLRVLTVGLRMAKIRFARIIIGE